MKKEKMNIKIMMFAFFASVLCVTVVCYATNVFNIADEKINEFDLIARLVTPEPTPKPTDTPKPTQTPCSQYPPYNCPSRCYKTATACQAPTATPKPSSSSNPTATPTPTPLVCSDGQYISDGSCVTCEKGYKCDGETRTGCGAGYYQDNTGQTSCKDCEAGYYCSGSANTSQTACTGNTYTDAKNKSSCDKCGVDKVKDDHTGCDTCSLSYNFGYKMMSPSETYTGLIVYGKCVGTVSITVSGGSGSTSSSVDGSGILYFSGSPTKKCSTLTASLSISNDGKSKSGDHSGGVGSVDVQDDWKKLCTNCNMSDSYSSGAEGANGTGVKHYGTGKVQMSDSSGTYYHYDEVYSRGCPPPSVQKNYNYCCVNNELPGLSSIVFPVNKARSKDCDYYAKQNGFKTGGYTLLLDKNTEGDFDMSKCVTPPEVPGRCNPSTINPEDKTVTADVCETTKTLTIDEGQKCTNTDNKENKSFYKIDCSKSFDTKFDYGDDNSTITSRGLYRGEGFAFGIYIDSTVYCTYRFYETVWKDVYDKFIEKIKLIDDDLVPFVKNNDADGWKKHIDEKWKGKLKDSNVSDLYGFWRVIEELKEVVETYNNYKSSDLIDEGAEITINTKEGGKTVKINDFFVRKLLDEGEMKKTNVTKKTLGIKNLKDPEDYNWSNATKPRKVKLTPKKTCIDKYDGAVTILNDETAECTDRNYYSGNKIYLGYDIDEGKYEINLTVSGLGTQNSKIINNKCDITVPTYKLQYRSIDVSNPFINKDWNKGANWVNSKYDFTGKIDANTWNKSSLNIINISGTEIGQIQNSNATHQKNSSEESKKVKSPYLGLCEVETGTDRDTITDTICSRIK